MPLDSFVLGNVVFQLGCSNDVIQLFYNFLRYNGVFHDYGLILGLVHTSSHRCVIDRSLLSSVSEDAVHPALDIVSFRLSHPLL